MTSLPRSLLLLAGLCLAACGGGDDGGDPVARCTDQVFDYTESLHACFPDQIAAVARADVESACAAEDSVWMACADVIDGFTTCGDRVGCDGWIVDCWDDYRDMQLCLGEEDPGDVPPSGNGSSCPWPDDGECDEPEGTNLCAEGTDVNDCAGGGGGGGGNACDPGSCSGCQYLCSDGFCITCCYSCSGDSCEQTCSE